MVSVKVKVKAKVVLRAIISRKVKKKDKKSFGKFSISSDKFSIFYSDIQKTPISSGLRCCPQNLQKLHFSTINRRSACEVTLL